MNVSDEITLKGNIPAGMQYEAELWRTSKDGNVRKNAATKYDDTDHKGVASEKVATTGRQDVPKSALGAHLEGVTFRTKSMESPGVAPTSGAQNCIRPNSHTTRRTGPAPAATRACPHSRA